MSDMQALYVKPCTGPRLEDGARDDALRVGRAAALHRVRLARAALPVAEQAHLRRAQATLNSRPMALHARVMAVPLTTREHAERRHV